jgi:hypothetical protein
LYSTLIAGQTYLEVGLEETLGLDFKTEGEEEGRLEGNKLDSSDFNTEGIKVGPSDLTSVGRFDGNKLGPSDLNTEGTTEAAVGKLVGGTGKPPTGAFVISGIGPSTQSLHATAL